MNWQTILGFILLGCFLAFIGYVGGGWIGMIKFLGIIGFLMGVMSLLVWGFLTK